MEIKELQIKEKTYKVQELKHKEATKILAIQDVEQRTRELICKSLLEPLLKNEDIDELPIKETLQLLRVINDLNGFSETNFR